MNKKKFKYKLYAFMIVVLWCLLLMSGCQREQSGDAIQTNSPKANTTSDSSIATSDSPAAANHQIEITSWNWGVEKRLVEVNGEVVNVSRKPLPPLMITVEVKAEDGRVVSTLQGKTASLKPNQSGTFHLEGELKAAPILGMRRFMMARDTLRFKTKSGEVIEYIDKSKDSPAKSKAVE